MSKEEVGLATIKAVVILHKATGLVIININPGNVSYDLDVRLSPTLETFAEEVSAVNLIE